MCFACAAAARNRSAVFNNCDHGGMAGRVYKVYIDDMGHASVQSGLSFRPCQLMFEDTLIAASQHPLHSGTNRLCDLCSRILGNTNQITCRECNETATVETEQVRSLHRRMFSLGIDEYPALSLAMKFLVLKQRYHHIPLVYKHEDDRRRWTEFQPAIKQKRQSLVRIAASIISGDPVEVDEMTALVETTAVEIDVDTDCKAEQGVPIKQMWLQVGQIPTASDIDERYLPPVGALGLLYACSLMNHSCRPNAEIVFPPGLKGEFIKAEVRALRQIEPGDEITIAYTDNPEELPELFGFHCKCDTCRA